MDGVIRTIADRQIHLSGIGLGDRVRRLGVEGVLVRATSSSTDDRGIRPKTMFAESSQFALVLRWVERPFTTFPQVRVVRPEGFEPPTLGLGAQP
jgi:hypothetical protein